MQSVAVSIFRNPTHTGAGLGGEKLFFTEKLFSKNYQVYLKETANQIVKEQSPRMLAEVIKDIPIGLFESGKRVENVQHICSQVRTRLYELIAHCIPPEVIFVGIQKELVKVLIC